MRIDIYRRAEKSGRPSYLVVPQGFAIPNEATNVDWESELSGFDMDDNPNVLKSFFINAPQQQIAAKGYAISALT